MNEKRNEFSFWVRCFERNNATNAVYPFVALHDLDFETYSAPSVGDIIIGEEQNYTVTQRQFEVSQRSGRISRCALLVEKSDVSLIEG